MAHAGQTHVNEMWRRLEEKRWRPILQCAVFCWAVISWVMAHSKQHLQLMLNSFKILGYIFSLTGKSQENLEDRIHKAHTAWYRNARLHRRAVQITLQTHGRNFFTASSFWSAEVGHGVNRS